jgi:hypothetical protein
MRIKSVTISSKGLDTPIRFPAPCAPVLLNAPDRRIRTNIDEENELHEPKILDAKQNIKIPRLV